ncbi:unnamed protein product [Fraxinus pennsylvanica]|uniref:EF-hand domain-containing protein n=1 Tax=Fraxinus pennsylvanica TaxID=56036 RepID=A0AAD2E5C3_9LAMI|nr:unnamed protein product [Fraxinus pennsylvanica]
MLEENRREERTEIAGGDKAIRRDYLIKIGFLSNFERELFRRLRNKWRKQHQRTECRRESSLSRGDLRFSGDDNDEAPTMDKWSEKQMVFKCFDEKGDGKISKEELRRRMRVVGGEMSNEEMEMVVSHQKLTSMEC